MYTSFETTKEMLDYYVSQNGLPFIADDSNEKPIGFIFQQSGGYDTQGLRQVKDEAEMYLIAAKT